MSNIGYVEPRELADWMDKNPNSVIVVDVRDVDFRGYKIPGSRHIPFISFSDNLPNLIESIKQLDIKPQRIVFHCKYRYAIISSLCFILFFAVKHEALPLQTCSKTKHQAYYLHYQYMFCRADLKPGNMLSGMTKRGFDFHYVFCRSLYIHFTDIPYHFRPNKFWSKVSGLFLQYLYHRRSTLLRPSRLIKFHHSSSL